MKVIGSEDIPTPRYMTSGSAGMDIYAAVDADYELKPGERSLISAGICLEIPISLSSSNRHVFKQLEEAFRCIENNLVYEWVDIPVPVKSARNI